MVRCGSLKLNIMNRLILFKGQTLSGDIVCGDLANNFVLNTKDGLKSVECAILAESGFFEVIKDTIKQYAYIETENGQSIFEGDCCIIEIEKPRSPNYCGDNAIMVDFKVKVEFDGSGFCFLNLQKGKAWKAWHRKAVSSFSVSNIRLIDNNAP